MMRLPVFILGGSVGLAACLLATRWGIDKQYGLEVCLFAIGCMIAGQIVGMIDEKDES